MFKKFQSKPSLLECNLILENLMNRLCEETPAPPLNQKALQIHFEYQYSYYDSLIIASALSSSCKTLYSEDLQNKQRIEHLTIRNPFTK